MIIAYKNKSIKTLQTLKFGLALAFLLMFIAFTKWAIFGLLLLPLILLFRMGVEIDFTKKEYRKYKQFIRKTGAWKDLNKFQYVVIKPFRGSRALYRPHFYSTVDIKKVQYEIYLMDKNHGSRLFIQKFDSIKGAEAFAKNVSIHTSFNVEKFKSSVRPMFGRRR